MPVPRPEYRPLRTPRLVAGDDELELPVVPTSHTDVTDMAVRRQVDPQGYIVGIPQGRFTRAHLDDVAVARAWVRCHRRGQQRRYGTRQVLERLEIDVGREIPHGVLLVALLLERAHVRRDPWRRTGLVNLALF